jgi:GNAT superfamily N-acetyltransferase
VNAEPLTLLKGPSAEVAALVVDENHRGKKVGQMLLTHAEKWAKKNSFEQIRIRTNVNRAQAHGFYSHCGYTLSKSWHLFVKPIEKDADLV